MEERIAGRGGASALYKGSDRLSSSVSDTKLLSASFLFYFFYVNSKGVN